MPKSPKLDVTFGSSDYRDSRWTAWLSAGVGAWTLWSTYLWFHTQGQALRLWDLSFGDLFIPVVWILSLLGGIAVISPISNAISRVLGRDLHRGYRTSCVIYTLALGANAALHAAQVSWVHQATGGLWFLALPFCLYQNRKIAKAHQATEFVLRGTSL